MPRRIDMLAAGPPEIMAAGQSLTMMKLTEKLVVLGNPVPGSISLARLPVTVKVYVPRSASVMLACCVSTKNVLATGSNVTNAGCEIEAALKTYAAVNVSPAAGSVLLVSQFFAAPATP